MELRLINSERMRDLLHVQNKRRIAQLYEDAADEAMEIANNWLARTGINEHAEVFASEYYELEAQYRSYYNQINTEVGDTTTRSMDTVANTTRNEFLQKMYSNGLPQGSYLLNVPTSVVSSILNGTVYTSPDNLGDRAPNWGLSKGIWGTNESVIKNIHEIIAKGVALGQDTLTISKQLEIYVHPNARRPWDWSKVYPNSSATIDYNAQRLARTLVSHAYQQTFKEVGQYNPWASYYVWHSVFEVNRTCQVCMDMDGNRYAIGGMYGNSPYPDMPLDHPNGLCYWTYEIDTTIMAQQLAERTMGVAEYPEIDKYIEWLNNR